MQGLTVPNNEEQRLDIIENCNRLLGGILDSYAQVDDTLEGRMVSQIMWLKERAENNDLSLPVEQDKLATLRYVYTDGELCRHATNPDDKSSVWSEVEFPMSQLLSLTKHGRLLLKGEYYTYMLRCIEALIHILEAASRLLTESEQGLIGELKIIKQRLEEGKIKPPYTCINYMPEYVNFIDVEGIERITIYDFPNGEKLFRTVRNLIFKGVRPDTWVTPADADNETKALI